jgi:hypothetical protein
VLDVAGRRIHQTRPSIYQELNGRRREISGGYTLKGGHRVGFHVAPYDRGRPLIIDPVLVYSTYLGGSGFDFGRAIAVDVSGNAYITGGASQADFPTTPGAFDTSVNGQDEAFVTKLDPTGSSLVYSTYLGGSGFDRGFGITVDATGSAYVTGQTSSSNFPTTALAFDSTLDGFSDVFVTRLDPTGSALIYSTYIGGSGSFNGDVGFGIAVDGSGSAYVTGYTQSADFPTTPGAFDSSYNGSTDAFVTKLNPAGSAPLLYSTFLGGGFTDQGESIALDASGRMYVTGLTMSSDFPTSIGAFDTTLSGPSDSFVTKLNPTAAAPLDYSTYLGGSGDDEGDGIAVDTFGNASVTGLTQSADFPTTAGAVDVTLGGAGDAFVTQINPSGSAPLIYSTYLGGSGFDVGRSLALVGSTTIFITGQTDSGDFPTTTDAFDATLGGSSDAFMTELESIAFVPTVYSTYLGGAQTDVGYGIAADTSGNAYVTGFTQSANFPTSPGAFDTTFGGNADGFVVKIGSAVGPPTTVVLTPPAATNSVGTQHCVTATVHDAGGNPVPDVTVRFSVTGSVNTSGSAMTDANGQATFCYMGPPLPGADVITAFADTDNDATQDPGEPSGGATKVWTLPVTTPLCEITITNGGWITAANGDRASFGGNAKADGAGNTQGQEEYQDHGPVQPMNVHAITVMAIVCDGTTQASIFGQATIDGAGSFFYRIRVKDLGEPGVGQDTYGLLLQTGYNSGEQVLQGGNVQIRRQ